VDIRGILLSVWGGLVDLVLPASCAGCGADGVTRLCPDCERGLAGLRPVPARPTPCPPGLPLCMAMGGYRGVLREVLLEYKERGRHQLAGVLGDLLAHAVTGALYALGHGAGTPALLVPVPDTAAAARSRYGDHMRRLAERAAARLNRTGWPAGVATALTARPRADSVHLSAEDRSSAAVGAFLARDRVLGRMRRAERRGAVPVVVDDILTTGATVQAVTVTLGTGGLPVAAAAVLAATERRSVE
jgi:predicted amidophosphoribosyltransferase